MTAYSLSKETDDTIYQSGAESSYKTLFTRRDSMERKGMSYLTKEILKQFTKKGQEVIVTDSKNEITGNKIVVK